MDLQAIVRALPEIFTQLFAFLIAFWILKRYAFKPVLQAIDARRKAIEDEFAAIEAKKKDLERLDQDYRSRIGAIEQEARGKIQEAADQGLRLSKDIQDKAREEAQKIADRARAEIEQELVKARLTMRNEIVELSGLIAEKVIHEKMDAAAHERLVDRFLKEIESIR